MISRWIDWILDHRLVHSMLLNINSYYRKWSNVNHCTYIFLLYDLPLTCKFTLHKSSTAGLYCLLMHPSFLGAFLHFCLGCTTVGFSGLYKFILNSTPILWHLYIQSLFFPHVTCDFRISWLITVAAESQLQITYPAQIRALRVIRCENVIDPCWEIRPLQ